MNKLAIIALASASVASVASADDLIMIDLSVANEVTIFGTTGNASASASASDFTGFLMADFFAVPGAGLGGVLAGAGDFTTFNEAADNSPNSFQGSVDTGWNIWDFSSASTVTVTAGQQAFTGSATYSLTAAQYAAFLGGAQSGDIIFGADTDDDAGVNIGTDRVIPAPSALALLGLGGLATARRRR